MTNLTTKHPPVSLESDHCDLEVTEGVRDSEWDSFLKNHSSGHHVQSSLWSEVKALNGWESRRVIVRQGERIVGGAQMLLRTVRHLGKVAYVPKGPVLIDNGEIVTNELLQEICNIAASENVWILFVQPAETGPLLTQLKTNGFAPCPVETAPSASILVDLAEEQDAILSRMTKGMRNGVRRGLKRGINVRVGQRSDIQAFHDLLTATSQRRGFSTFELEYFQGMWDILEPLGCLKLFLAELNGEAVSAQFCVAFGDVVVAKQIGWSGKHSQLHPNEALDWFTIGWAKDNGYRYYDLEGIERSAAKAIVTEKPLPKEFSNSPTAYKLRMGGKVELYPEAWCFVSNPMMRSLYNRIGFKIASWPVFQNAISRFRTS